jgi:DNA-binding PadR family transcriptional regulator
MKRSMTLIPHVSFGIMFALSLQPRHGYEIMQQVVKDSGGRIKLGPGALYGSLKQLLDEGLIEELEGIDDRERRRYYKLTAMGWECLNEDIKYFKTTVSLARKRLA